MVGENLTVVAIYELVATGFLRVAEFRLGSRGTVELTLADPGGCPLARHWFEDGIATTSRQQRCTPDDGTEFLCAVLRSRAGSYTRIVDESAGTRSPERRTPAGGAESAPRPSQWQ